MNYVQNGVDEFCIFGVMFFCLVIFGVCLFEYEIVRFEYLVIWVRLNIVYGVGFQIYQYSLGDVMVFICFVEVNVDLFEL